jgi:hypothetical protein
MLLYSTLRSLQAKNKILMGLKPTNIYGVWNMNKFRLLGAMCATSLVFSMATQAASFDFSGGPGYLGSNTLVDNGVTAVATYYNGDWQRDASLYQRNETNDHGIGVCSEGQSACDSGGGDVNELSNQLYYEVIRLDLGDWAAWSSLWVSSLDSQEVGTLYWGDSPVIDTLLSGDSYTYMAGVGAFAGGVVEADIFAGALAAGFDPTAQYLLFTPGTPGAAPDSLLSSINCAECGTTDNDYLVWKGTVVPVPAAVWLFGSGLLGLVGIARRKKAA